MSLTTFRRAGRRSAVLLAAAASATALLTATGPPAAAAVPNPVVTASPAGSHGFPFLAAAEDLAVAGYVEREFQIAGTARSYGPAGTAQWGRDGRWSAVVAGSAAYRTRMLVRRPADPARFNGTVVVEWLNVTSGVDLSPDWWFARDELLRRGYAWVGVSAQRVGVDGSPLTPQWPGLRTWDAQRYGTLTHPGDQYAYDIFSQAAQAIRTPDGPDPLGDLDVTRVLADGESQSAGMLVTYVNAVHPLARVYDGFLVHSRGESAHVVTPSGAVQNVPALLRTDRTEPALTVQSEWDVRAGGHLARQPDTANTVTWEVTGTAHADRWSYDAGEATVRRSLGAAAPAPPACPVAVNDGPQHWAVNAAVNKLDRWTRGGGRPASGAAIEVAAFGSVVGRDPATGLARGGIRLPDVAVPTRTLTGEAPLLPTDVCYVFGYTDPWNGDADAWDAPWQYDPSDPTWSQAPEPSLRALYPSHADYVSRVQSAADTSYRAGHLLAEDALRIIQRADRSGVPS